MNFNFALVCFALIAANVAQLPITTTAATSTTSNPAITAWIKSTGYNGYNSQLADVQKVQYSSNYVYVSSTSVPGTYTVGQPGYSTAKPWADCP